MGRLAARAWQNHRFRVRAGRKLAEGDQNRGGVGNVTPQPAPANLEVAEAALPMPIHALTQTLRHDIAAQRDQMQRGYRHDQS